MRATCATAAYVIWRDWRVEGSRLEGGLRGNLTYLKSLRRQRISSLVVRIAMIMRTDWVMGMRTRSTSEEA